MHRTTLAILAVLVVCLLPAHSANLPLVDTNSTWRLFKGTTEASSPDLTQWRGVSFNDASFVSAPAPFTYGENYAYGTVLNDMLNAYSCFFLRRTFVITNVAELSALRFGAKVDDGYVAWINGVEVVRFNIGGGPGSAVTIATLAAGATEPVPFDFFTILNPGGFLSAGTNVLAVQVFNTTLGSSDIVFDCSLEGIPADLTPPTIVSVSPAPGSVLTNLTQVTVEFSEPLTGLDADDLTLGGVGASALSQTDNRYTFAFPQPQAGNVPVSWMSGHGITDLGLPPNAFNETAPGASWSYTLLDVIPPSAVGLFPQPGSIVRSLGQVQVTFSEAVLGLQASDLRINGQPATNLLTQPGLIHIFQFPPQPDGPVTLTWAPGHGIADGSGNSFAGGLWSYTVDASANPTAILITEINTANQTGLTDEDGEEQDWIELFNAGQSTVNLANWSLSDSEEEPGRWVFPARTLAPGEYLVVFASGKDRTAPTGTNRFHTSFKLGGSREFLGLFTPDSPRQLASGFPSGYPEQRNDHSYGLDGTGQWRYFATPTPGAANGTSTISGIVDRVHFSTTRGFFSQPFTLVLSSGTRGAVIRYTRDGSEPTLLNGTTYTVPLVISNSTFLRAAAFKENELPSSIDSHSFLFNQTAAIRSLPALSIQTWSNNMTGRSGIIGMSGGTGPPSNPWTALTTNDYHNPTKTGIAWERPMSVEFIRPLDNSGFQIDCGMRVQGSDYTRPRYAATDKFSYRLYFRGDYGSSRLEYPFFSDSVVQNFDQIVLRAGHNDISDPFIRDELTRQLSADMGQVASHGSFVNLFINGVAKGYYNPTERVEEGFLQNWHGGSNSWDIITVGSVVQGGDSVEWNSLRSYINSQNLDTPAVFNEVLRRLDVVNFIDYLLVNTYAATWDWPHNNWRAARERAPGGKFRFYVWDAEGAFGLTGRNAADFDSFATTDSGLLTSGAEIPVLYQRLRNSAEFRLLWADRVHRHFFNGGALTDTNVAQRFIQMRAEMAGVLPNMNSTILNTWVPTRRTPILNQYRLYGLLASSNAPVFNQHGSNVPPGFVLTMSATNSGGNIYYTTNGADPRVMYTGTLSNSAVLYTGPIPLNQSVLIKARTLNGTNWSALAEARFDVAARGVPVRISEINYNPADSTAYEFIELQNLSAAPVNLSGLYFSGITFTFPNFSTLAAGGRLVLASDFDPGAFAVRYPGVNVAGYFGGSLNNGGERLALLDAQGNVITSVDYGDTGGWPTAADGGGSSLENINLNGDPDDPANWRPSVLLGGTPGIAAAFFNTSSVRLNEVLAENLTATNLAGTHPDFVELANTGGTSVNLDGWSLSDDGNARKFVFPPGTSIAPGGYLVVWCDAATNTAPGLHSGFALDRDGDSLFLYDAGVNLVDALTIGRQLPDYSVGRVGGVWKLNPPTPNAANQAVSTGSGTSLSINEFLANPSAGQPDWIELYNNSAQPVALQGLYLANTSAVHQVTSLSFIAPFGHVQFLADESVGPLHLDFKLPATNGVIELYDAAANLLDRLTYGQQTEGVSRGRLPDGTGSLVNFVGTASPGTTNYALSYNGPVLNEVLARNESAITNALGRTADFIELYHPGGSSFSLAGFSLSLDPAIPGPWRFPPEAVMTAGGYLTVWCDDAEPASTNAGSYNLGLDLGGSGGGVYLFNPGGQLVSYVEYGQQAPNRSIGLASSVWRLLNFPTPGGPNQVPAPLATPSTHLRLNEWMANPASGSDWFELFNATNLPTDLSGLILTDDASYFGTNAFRIPALSFIGAGGFAVFTADGRTDLGSDHVSFSLNELGETVRLYAANGSTVLSSVTFGPQSFGLSQGRSEDGGTDVVNFPNSSTPGSSNYRLLTEVEISETLSFAPSPDGNEIELHNPSPDPVPLGGWFLSDDSSSLKKFRIPDGTILPPGGFIRFNQAQFSAGPNGFSLDRTRAGEIWLTAADAGGNLTGFRTQARFGPAGQNESFGRYEYAGLTEMVAQSTNTLGAANAGPRLGPVVISELMYHPPEAQPAATEFIELRNLSSQAVALFAPAQPAQTWKLTGGVSFSLPANTTLPAGGVALVVDFDPVADPAALTAFRTQYGVDLSVPIWGPFLGQLANSGETIELRRPEIPGGGIVPYVLVDAVRYQDSAPWPTGADGDGLSLQRRPLASFGKNPANWIAANPTAGAANATGNSGPTITQSPADLVTTMGSPLLLQAQSGGSGLRWQWRFNGLEIPGQTNAQFQLDYALVEDSGRYDAYVVNADGTAFTEPAQVVVAEIPSFIQPPPALVMTNAGSNYVFTAVARGTEPLRYQWLKDGVSLPGATASSLALTNAGYNQMGVYTLRVTNAFGSVSANANFVVLIRPSITIQPAPQTVPQGGTALFTAVAGPTHPLLPLSYRWLRNGILWVSNQLPELVITNCQSNGTFRLQVINAAGSQNSTPSTGVALTVLPDFDQDGLPDAWELAYAGFSTNAPADGTLDFDGDGLSNRQEFLAGTDPLDDLSTLALFTSATNQAELNFVAQSNHSYSVQFRTSLESTNWQALSNLSASASNRVIQFNVPNPHLEPQRFYRIATPARP